MAKEPAPCPVLVLMECMDCGKQRGEHQGSGGNKAPETHPEPPPTGPSPAPLIFVAAGWVLTRQRLKFQGKNVNKGPCPACPHYLRNPEPASPFSELFHPSHRCWPWTKPGMAGMEGSCTSEPAGDPETRGTMACCGGPAPCPTVLGSISMGRGAQ